MFTARDHCDERFYTLITGGSEGIGKSLAIECAKKGWHLILIALPGEELGSLTSTLMATYGIDVKYLELDLTEKEAPLRVYDWCSKQGLRINRLINNASLGYTGIFEQCDFAYYERIMRLNMVALTLLTRVFLPELKDRDIGYILNVGSVGSLIPLPFKTVYGASKSFVLSFTLALREEVKGSKVKISILCPGPVPTNQDVRERIASENVLSKIALLSPDKVARTALRKWEKSKKIIIPGLINRLAVFILFLIPRWLRSKVTGWFYHRYSYSS